MSNDSSSPQETNYYEESTQMEGMYFYPDSVIVHDFWGAKAFVVLIFGILLYISLFVREVILIIIFGIIEVVYLYSLFRSLVTILNPIEFDILNGTLYPEGYSHEESAVLIKEIDYLQILGIEKNHVFYHELNAVLKDGKRLHIIDYSTYSKCAADAQKLAKHLTLPLKDEHGELFMGLPGKHKGPFSSGGEYYQDTYLVFKEDSISLRATLDFFLLYILLMLGGLLFIGIGLFKFDSFGWHAIIAIIIGVFMCMFSLFICYGIWKRRTAPFFDMLDGMFYPNRFNRDSFGISLKQLDHLEILTKRVSGDKKNYYPQELNVVLKDGSRYNILNHADKECLLADAYALANRLSLPLVNAHDGKTIPIPPTDNPKKNS